MRRIKVFLASPPKFEIVSAESYSEHSLKILDRESIREFTKCEQLDVLIVGQVVLGCTGYIRNYGAATKENLAMGFDDAAFVDTTLATVSHPIDADMEGHPKYLMALRYSPNSEPRFGIWQNLFETMLSKIPGENISAGIYIPVSPWWLSDKTIPESVSAIVKCAEAGLIELA